MGQLVKVKGMAVAQSVDGKARTGKIQIGQEEPGQLGFTQCVDGDEGKHESGKWINSAVDQPDRSVSGQWRGQLVALGKRDAPCRI
jgi:hypothetical protein